MLFYFFMIYRPAFNNNSHYTKLPNLLLRGGVSASEAREDSLTPEALGVLVYLLSHVEDWQVTQTQLCTVFAVGKTKMQSITKCLESSGYLKKHASRDGKGQFGGYDWLVTDTRNEFPDSVKPTTKTTEADFPSTGNPATGNPATDNPPQRITITTEEHWKEALLNKCPTGVSKKAWEAWWDYKVEGNGNRKVAKGTITRQAHDFEVMQNEKFDMNKVVEFAISRGWQRVGQPDWQGLQCFKNISRHDDLLGAVK